LNEQWGPHDVGGLPAGPVDLAEHDTAHWEWQVDAMVRLALKKGLISDFAELRDGIERLAPEVYERCTYYERWARALAFALTARGVISDEQLVARAELIRARQEAAGRA
jgi:hypothetical protein